MEDAENTTLYCDGAGPDRLPDLSYLEATLGYRMKRALVGLYRGIYESLGDDGLTLVQFSVLSIARDNPGIAQSELAGALGVERPRLVPVIDALERRGLAERYRNPEDRRGRMIYLTREGMSHIDRLKLKFDTYQDALREKMGGVAFDQLLEALAWISDNAAGMGRPDGHAKDAEDVSQGI